MEPNQDDVVKTTKNNKIASLADHRFSFDTASQRGEIRTSFVQSNKSLTMRILAASIALIGSALVIANPWHPEWGPNPPVAPYTMALLPSQRIKVPMIFPVLGKSHWKDGYGEVRGNFRHTGIDICADKWTPIVAPFSGRIGLKPESFWIYGDNGWMMLGTHLNNDNPGTHDAKGDRDVMFAPNVEPNQHVSAGQFIGYVGESGDATGPHLHFEIYAPGEGSTLPRIRDPFPSLKASQVIMLPRSAAPNVTARPKTGEVRYMGCIRKLDQKAGTVTLLMTNVQLPNGVVNVATKVRYKKVTLAGSALADVGGWQALESVPSWQQVSAYVDSAGNIDVRDAKRITIEK